MTRPTSTRAELRRIIAKQLMMPFARRVQSGYSLATQSSSSSIYDSQVLGQLSSYWKGQWAYIPGTGEVRQIVSSSAPLKSCDLEYNLSSALGVGGTYEIHSVFNAIEIHDAIDRAIAAGHPAFFDNVEDKTTVICEDKIEYDLTAISPVIDVIYEVALERPTTRFFATITSINIAGGNWDIYVDADLTQLDANWWMSVYDGDGEGSARSMNDMSWFYPNPNYIRMTAATPYISGINVGDKLLFWDAREQLLDWYRLKNIHLSSKEYPSTLRLYAPIYDYRGSRLRIKYTTNPLALATETATTVVPKEYIVPKAIAILASTRLGDNRVDRQRYAIMYETYTKEAEDYKARNFFRRPDGELFMEGRDYSNLSELDPNGDPMGWYRR